MPAAEHGLLLPAALRAVLALVSRADLPLALLGCLTALLFEPLKLLFTGALDRALMHMDADQNLFTLGTDDQAEAAAAYRAGRDPRFTGD